MRMVLKSAFDRFSGYGNDAIDLAVNLERLGVDVHLWPTNILPGLPRSFTRLLEKEPGGRKDVLLQFADPPAIQPWEIMKGFAPKVFGYTMWERCPLTREDLPWGRRSRRWSTYGMRGMAVTCEMNLEAVHALDPDLNMTVVPCGIEPSDWPERVAPRTGPVKFLIIGVLGGRKDPFRLLGAWKDFREQYPEVEAELTVHTYSPGLHPRIADWYGPGITFSQRALSRAELQELYLAHDVLVSVSRGEGNNKPAMEFLATGGTVMASDWAGHQNWLHPAYTTALPGELAEAHGNPKAQEFLVEHGAVVKALHQLASNPVQTRARGMAAAPYIRQKMAWQALLPPFIDWMERT